MPRRRPNFWNTRGWIIIAFGSILLLLLLSIFSPRQPSYYMYQRSPSDYLLNTKYPNRPKYKTSTKTSTKTSIKTLDQSELNPKSPQYISKTEAECKIILEKLFGVEFSKVRPKFLKNDVTGKNLELDLYNPELNLCVEINGKQHYEYIPYFHNNKEAFFNQRYRDEMKKTKCRENGINYIEVPYHIKLSQLEDYIKLKCKDFGYNI